MGPTEYSEFDNSTPGLFGPKHCATLLIPDEILEDLENLLDSRRLDLT